MPFCDLREFIERLEEDGELIRIKRPVDLDFEISAVIRRSLDICGLEENKALLFEDPGGCPTPLVTNLLATRRRYALAMGVEVGQIHKRIVEAMERPVDPILVDGGPCKEKILIGGDVDLSKFPIPLWNEADAGPYITHGLHITKDPETGERNLAIYRNLVHDRNHLGILAGPYRHLALQCKKAHARGEPFPVAICIGTDPTIYMAAVAPLRQGEDELALAGAMRGGPVEVVKCETIDLEVPASAEIVLEGEIRPGDLREEGPFGEFTGYYGGERAPRPVITIKAITHREFPIYQGGYQGRPPKESSITEHIVHEAQVMRSIRMPGLVQFHLPVGGIGMVAIASMKKPYEGYAKVMGLAILSTEPGRLIKTLILVDDDVDPFDRSSVDWALATRFQPVKDLILLEGVPGMPLDPSMPREEKINQTNLTSKIIMDATRPLTRDFPNEVKPPKEVMDKVERDWKEYGIT